MLKKLILTAAAFLLISVTAANAQYYHDRYYDIKNAVLKDGTAYVGTYWDKWFFLNCEKNGEEAVLSFKENSLTVTADSDKAEFNGEAITLTNTPYMDGEYIVLPVREIIELFGGYVHYEDETGDVVAEYGRDIIKESGVVGDSYNNWSITLPEGFYHYSDSVDSSTVYFENFNGVRISVMMADEEFKDAQPDSLNLEDYLYRREVEETENSEYLSYIIEGKVYSHPTEENRAMLNSIMDSFKTYFADGAADISNINEDGSGWKYADIDEGIAFDIPLSWDNNYSSRASSYEKGYLRGNPGYLVINGIYSGLDNLPFIYLTTSLIKDISAEEFMDTFKRDAEYVSSDISPVFEKFEVGDKEVYKLEEQGNTGTDMPDAFILCDDGRNTHILKFNFSFGLNEGEDEHVAKARIDGIIEKIISTLEFSEPEGNGKKYFTADTDTVEEKELNGFKFSVPKRFFWMNGADSAVLLLSNREEEMYAMLPNALARILSYNDMDSEEILEEIKNNERMLEFNDMGEFDLNGRNCSKYTYVLHDGGYDGYDGYKFVLKDERTINGTIYVFGDTTIVAEILFMDGADMDSQYAKDLQAVIDSVH